MRDLVALITTPTNTKSAKKSLLVVEDPEPQVGDVPTCQSFNAVFKPFKLFSLDGFAAAFHFVPKLLEPFLCRNFLHFPLRALHGLDFHVVCRMLFREGHGTRFAMATFAAQVDMSLRLLRKMWITSS